MAFAVSTTASRLSTNLTPPALPRPPAWIWALTTQRSPPNALAALRASSGEKAGVPLGTATP